MSCGQDLKTDVEDLSSLFDKYLQYYHQCLHQSSYTLRVPRPRSLLKLWGTRAQVPRKSLFWARCIIKTFKVIMIILRGVKYWRSFTKGPTWLRIKQVHGNSPGLDSPSESPRTCFNVFVNFVCTLRKHLNIDSFKSFCHSLVLCRFASRIAGFHKLKSHYSPKDNIWEENYIVVSTGWFF